MSTRAPASEDGPHPHNSRQSATKSHPGGLHAAPGRTRPLDRLLLATLLVGTGMLYLWNLGANGWANAYYSAAAQAGAQDWTAFLFGSFDWANSITVDKPPASLWIPALSVRFFGLNTYSVLVPQVLMGIASVFLLYATVTRVAGRRAGLLAGLVLALTPVALLMFRYNNPEALLVLLMTAAAYCLLRALQAIGGRALSWLLLAGALLGLGFLTKQMQVFLVVPGFAAAYLLTARVRWGQRVLHLLAAGAAMAVAAGRWLVLVELWPAATRPYIGGSQTNSILELTFGYNGLGRLNGDLVGSVGNPNRRTPGAWRLFTGNFSTQISWLIPAALILLAGTIWILWGTRAWRNRPGREFLGLVIAYGTWLVGTGLVFSFMQGTIHHYYSAALAPPVAALVGMGAWLMWKNRNRPVAMLALAASIVAAGYWAGAVVEHDPTFIRSWADELLLLSVAGALLLLACAWWPRKRSAVRFLLPVAVALSLVAALAAPAAYSVATTLGARTGALVLAGPVEQGTPPAQPGGGLLRVTVPGPGALEMLRADAGDYRWAAATTGANNAAGYQLGAGVPVMPVGGFNGTDPYPTLAQFKEYVAAGQIHYWITGRISHEANGGSKEPLLIRDWVEANFTGNKVDGSVFYDLTVPPSGG
ncbi:glycosyltransferase family 39 protein [Paeniglutamicibacter kerguelensis]